MNGNVGVEEWSRAPSGVVINEIKQGFADAGANVVDGLVGRGQGEADQVGGGDRGDEEGGVDSGQGHEDGTRAHSARGNGNRVGRVSRSTQ